MTISRRNVLGSALACMSASVLNSPAWSQQFPNAPIRVVIPTAVGGGYDLMMRAIGQKMLESWGQACVVDPRTGASGSIAAQIVAKAPPDGYTLMVGYSALVSNLVLQQNPGYALADFAPVSMLTISPIALAVRDSLGVNTLQEFVALAKSQPGKLSYGSYGPGSGGHFVGEQLKQAAGIHVTHLPYRGETPAIQDLLAGQIDAATITVGGATRYPGKIKPLAICSPSRFPLYPDIPTFAEAGFAAVNMPGWGGLFAPAATPKPVIEKLAHEVNRIIKLPDVAKKILELGFEPVGWPAEKVTPFLNEQLKLTASMVSSGRVKIN